MARINKNTKSAEVPPVVQESKTVKVRTVYGRMVDLSTDEVYPDGETVEVPELTPFMQAQLEAGKISVEW